MFPFRRISANLVLLFAGLSFVTVGLFVIIVTDFDRRMLTEVKKEQGDLLSRALTETWESRMLDLTTLLAQRFIVPLHESQISEMSYRAELASKGESIRYIYVHDAGGAHSRRHNGRGAAAR